MKKSKMMSMLLEAHRQIGELEERNAQTQAELQRMRLESIDPRKFHKLLEEALDETKNFVPMVKLIRAVTGRGLGDSKQMAEESAIGLLIRANKINQ